MPADDGLDYQRIYEYRHQGVAQAKRQSVWNEIGAHVYAAMGRPRRVLDPAAGRGEFINAIGGADERWVVDAVDHGNEFLDAGVKVIVADIFDADLPDGYFDGIFVSNFLEHLESPEAIAAFLRKMLDVTAPGGRLAVLGPNFRYASREYFDCADHRLALTHVAVAEHLYASGWAVRSVAPRFIPYSFRSLLPASAALTRAYLKAPIAWRLLGKQFLVIAERPAA